MLSRWLREALTGGVLLAFVVGVVSGQDDRDTLSTLYSSLGGTSWTNSYGWTDDNVSLENWHGVYANGTEVFALELDVNNLVGEFPDLDDGVLPGLVRLILYGNEISGEIRTWIGSLPKLVNLNLYNNALEGEIPPELGQATSLTSLNLGENSLEGSIPSELGNLTSLKFLKLDGNYLEGIVPDDVWGLSLMENLVLGDNNLEGTISSKVGLMTGLSLLDLNSNSFSGEIPDELGELAEGGDLSTVDLSDNYLTGSVPDGLDDTNIETLDLSDNNLDSLDFQRTDGATAAPYSTPAPTEPPPTPQPTMLPTPQPTMFPTPRPTMLPTPHPTMSPTRIPVPLKPSAPPTPPSSASPTSSGAPSMPPPASSVIPQTGGEPTDETSMTAAVAVSAVVVLLLAAGLAYRKFRPQQNNVEIDGPCKKPSMIVPSPHQLEPDAQYPAMVHPLRLGDTEIDAGNEFVFSSPRVMESGYLPHTTPQPSTEHPSMNEDRPRALVDGRGSHDTDSVSGREKTKLGTADRRGGSTSARSPSRFGRALVDGHRSHDIDPVSGREETKLGTADRRGGSASARPPSRFSNAMNQMLCTTRATARAAQSSSISLVPEVAVLVETLVGLVEDSRTNPDVFEKSNELCRWLMVVLESANQLPGLDTNPSGVSDLLRCVKESVESLVGVMKTYQDAGKVSQVFMASVYRKRHEAAKEAVREMLQYFQTPLFLHVSHQQAHEQERSRKEIQKLRETVAALISKIDLEPHARRPKVDSVSERRAKLLDNMEIAEEDIEISANVLGEGVSGKVYFADYRGLNAAAKIMELEGDRNEKKQRNAFLNELQHMKRLASAHTVQVFGMVTSKPGELTLVMELMPGGDLFLYISKKREENQAIPEIARRLIGDVAAGMEFLHSSNTWHGDLKSPNVLLDASDRAKISDFGTSHWTEQTKSKSVQSNCRISGTAWFDTLTFRWAAPEVLSASEEQQLTRRQARTTPVAASPRPTTRLSFKSDVYSFAIIAWEILSLKVPWDKLSSGEIYVLVCWKQDRPAIPEGAPPDLAELVQQCWDASPERRPTSRQILDRLGRNRR